MKKYVKISVSAIGYYSGNTYYEEVFLPLEVWLEIKDCIDMQIEIGELDGKHAHVMADIEVEEMDKQELTTYQPSEINDGEDLFYHIYEYLNPEKYDDNYLLNIQEEVEALCQVETLSVVIPKDKKEEVLNLLKDYLVS